MYFRKIRNLFFVKGYFPVMIIREMVLHLISTKCFIWYQFFCFELEINTKYMQMFLFYVFFFFSHLNVKKCIPSNYLKYSRFLRFSIFLKLWFVINANSIYKIWLGVIQIYFMLQIKHVEYYKYVWTILLIQYIMLK